MAKGGWIITIKDHGRDALESLGILKPKPIPRTHKDAAFYDKAKRELYKGKWYYFCNELDFNWDLNKDGHITNVEVPIPERKFLVWKYRALESAYSREIQKFEIDINLYKREIERIERYIAKQKSENDRNDMKRELIIRQRDKAWKDLRLHLRTGSTGAHTDVKDLKREIKRLDKELGKYKVNDKYYIADWEDDPPKIQQKNAALTGKPIPPKRNQDLYALIYSHKKRIKFLKKHHLKPAEIQLDRTQYHLRKWLRKK